MKTVFQPKAVQDFQLRIEQLSPESTAKWGKMNLYQMLTHCYENDRMMLQHKKYKRLFFGRLFGKSVMLKMVKDDSSLEQNQPTHPDLKIKGNGETSKLKKQWKTLLNDYEKVSSHQIKDFVHPFFGKMTKEQFGIIAYKHINHHLTQFGV